MYIWTKLELSDVSESRDLTNQITAFGNRCPRSSNLALVWIFNDMEIQFVAQTQLDAALGPSEWPLWVQTAILKHVCTLWYSPCCCLLVRTGGTRNLCFLLFSFRIIRTRSSSLQLLLLFLNRSFFEDEFSSKFSVYKSHIGLDWSNLQCRVVFRHCVRCINVTLSVYRKLNILTSAESEPYSLSSHLVESLWKSLNQLKSILKTFFSYCRWTDQSRNRLTGRCTLL